MMRPRLVPYYAIMHKPSGNFLPAVSPGLARKAQSGPTHQEPLPTFEAVPRLFRTKQHAACALAQWLKGIWAKDNLGARYIPVPTRKAEEMEIIEAMLMLPEVPK